MPYKDPKNSLKAVKKHYECHKNEVLKKRIISRILQGAVPQQGSLDKFVITADMLNEMRAEVNLPPITIKPTRKKKMVKEPIKTKISLQYIHDHYNTMVKEDKIAPKTGEDYYKVFRRVMQGSGCEDLDMIECLKTKDVIKYLQNKYSANPNTLHTYLTAVLNVIDTIPIISKEVDRDAYKEAWDQAKAIKETFNIQKKLTEKVIKFTDLKKRIENENPDWSEEVLMINLYDEITVRNDFDNLTFDTTDPNHIDLEDGTITLKEFNKTDKRYKPIINYKLSNKFIETLKKSLKSRPREKVFTKQMRSILKKAKTGINEIRHSKISEELSGENIKDETKRKALQEKMLHSSATQLNYIRELK